MIKKVSLGLVVLLLACSCSAVILKGTVATYADRFVLVDEEGAYITYISQAADEYRYDLISPFLNKKVVVMVRRLINLPIGEVPADVQGPFKIREDK